MNLTETALFVRRAAVLCVVFVIGFFVLKFSFAGIVYLVRLINPPPPPPVTTIFGQLPPLVISPLPIENADNITYTIDTPTGKFPALPVQANVYKIPHPPATLLSESRARALARSLAFKNEPTRVSSSELHWEDVPTSRTMDINIVTGTFSLKTDPAKLALDLTHGSAPTQAQAINQVLSSFTNKQLLSQDYIEGAQTTTLIEIATGNYRESQSLSEAQLTRVNLFRRVDKLNVYGPAPKEGLIYADVSTARDVQQLPAINYFGWGLDYNKIGKYPLKSVDNAFLELKSGRGGFVYLSLNGQELFASYSPLSLGQVSIRTVEVAYYDSKMLQDYLQPIYVFGGIFKTTGGTEGKFTAYVPAIDSSWVKTPPK